MGERRGLPGLHPRKATPDHRWLMLRFCDCGLVIISQAATATCVEVCWDLNLTALP